MNVWLWAATGMLLALVPAMVVCFRGRAEDRLAGLEMAGVLVTLDMVLVVEGFHRIPFYDLPLTLALLSFGGGMVFARFIERWL